MSKCSVRKLEAGNYFSRLSFGRIVGKEHGAVIVENEQGVRWTVTNEIFEAEFTIANQSNDEVKLNQTQLIDRIMQFPRTAITIHFRKKPVAADVTKSLREFLKDNEVSGRKFSSFVKEALAGEPRTIIGRHFGETDPRGRLHFLDVEQGGMRLVDPRTVEWAIIDNVKYVVS